MLSLPLRPPAPRPHSSPPLPALPPSRRPLPAPLTPHPLRPHPHPHLSPGSLQALGTLIEGESLLNDGSAVVLFTWVRNVIGYTHATDPPPWMLLDGEYVRYAGEVGWELTRVIAQMLGFGLVFGVMFGWATITMSRFVYNQARAPHAAPHLPSSPALSPACTLPPCHLPPPPPPPPPHLSPPTTPSPSPPQLYIEAPVVLAMSYLCFWMGELVCGTSAVIAVVIMGLYVNKHRSEISADVFHFLHQVPPSPPPPEPKPEPPSPHRPC